MGVRLGYLDVAVGPYAASRWRTWARAAEPDAGQASVLGLDVVRRAGLVRAVIGLAGQYAAVDENLTGRENLAPRTGPTQELVAECCQLLRRIRT